jgi:hypothetical protein
MNEAIELRQVKDTNGSGDRFDRERRRSQKVFCALAAPLAYVANHVYSEFGTE